MQYQFSAVVELYYTEYGHTYVQHNKIVSCCSTHYSVGLTQAHPNYIQELVPSVMTQLLSQVHSWLGAQLVKYLAGYIQVH